MMPFINPIIQLKNIKKNYKENENAFILNGIDLNVYSGDFIVIRGESGSGKTTLLRILGLIDKEYFGNYCLNGIDIHTDKKSLSWNIQEEIRAKSIGFVFQEAYLFEYINIEENIFLPMKIHNIESQETRQNFFSLIDSMYTSRILNEENPELSKKKLNDLLIRYPGNISIGEKQRFSILRALSHNPIFILADEPTANLDKNRKKNIFDILLKLSKSGKTIIVVSHDEVFLNAPTVYELQNGKLKLINKQYLEEKNNDIFKNQNKDAIKEPTANDNIFFSPINDQNENNISSQKKLLVSQYGKKILSKKNIWFGFKPRTNLLFQINFAIKDLYHNMLFTILTIGALLLGSFQFIVMKSLRSGTDALLDETIQRGSRLTRIDIKPKNLSDNERFPDKNRILIIPNVSHFIERREGIYRIKDWRNRVRKETIYGIETNDPELEQLIFIAGGKFTSDSALEIIISERSIKKLFNLENDMITDEFRNHIIGKKLLFSVARANSNTTLDTAPDKMQFEEFSISLTIVGIVARAEAGRNFYLPLKTQLILEKWRLDKQNAFSIPYDPRTEKWKVSASLLTEKAKFNYSEKAHIYVNNIKEVIPVFKKLSSLGYNPEAKIFDYKWVLDIRKLAELFLLGIVIVVAIIACLIIFGNIHISVKLRKKDIVYFKLLGMRDGDISLIFIWSAFIAALMGIITGFIIGCLGISFLTNYLKHSYPNTQFFKLFGNPWQFFPEIVLIGICLAIFAAVIPAYQAGKTNPAEGFKNNL